VKCFASSFCDDTQLSASRWHEFKYPLYSPTQSAQSPAAGAGGASITAVSSNVSSSSSRVIANDRPLVVVVVTTVKRLPNTASRRVTPTTSLVPRVVAERFCREETVVDGSCAHRTGGRAKNAWVTGMAR
jgi:hypothetical protein